MKKEATWITAGALFAIGVAVLLATLPKAQPKPKGIFLENTTWLEAEKILTPETVVVIPLGAASKEHGSHLPLNTDWLQAEYFKHAIAERADVVIAPTISYGYYPAFLEYPGSTSVGEPTARSMIIDICKSISGYGPKRFYFINVGVSTVRPLERAEKELKQQGILIDWSSDVFPITPNLAWFEKSEGSHANEFETSVMLFIAPHVVNMSKAARDYTVDPDPRHGLTRDPNNSNGTYSPTGIWGDATRATKEKGKAAVEAKLGQMLKDIAELRAAPLPK